MSDHEREPLLGYRDSSQPSKIRAQDPISESNPIETNGNGNAADSGADADGPKKEIQSHFYWSLPAIFIGVFMAAIDGLIVNAIYAKLGNEFGNLDLAQWLSTGFFLAMSSTLPLYGKLSDIFGRKPCFLFCYALFALGSLLCGLARSMPHFIAARVVQGCGAGGIHVLALVWISDNVPGDVRGIWQGYLNVVMSVGMALGVTIGGLFADTIGWRWMFLIQAVLAVLGVVDMLVFMTEERGRSELKAKLKRVDFPGAILLVASVTTLLFGLDQGGRHAFHEPVAFVPLLLFPILIAIFIFIELKVSPEPFTPARLFTSRHNIAIYIINFAVHGVGQPILFYLPLFYQAVDRLSSAQTGVYLLPAVLSSLFGAMGAGLILKKSQRFRILLTASCSTGSLGVLLLVVTIVISQSPTDRAIGLSIASGITTLSLGAAMNFVLIALISSVPAADQAIATACMLLFRSVGSGVGISLTGTLIQSALERELGRRLRGNGDAQKLAGEIRRSLGFIDTLKPGLQTVARQAYQLALRDGFAFDTGLLMLAVVAALFLRSKKKEAAV